jgi:hypothetical protein
MTGDVQRERGAEQVANTDYRVRHADPLLPLERL